MLQSTLELDTNSCEDLTVQTLEAKNQILSQQPNSLQISGWRSLGNVLRLLGKLEESELVLQTIAQSSSDTDPAATQLSLQYFSVKPSLLIGSVWEKGKGQREKVELATCVDLFSFHL